MADWCNARLVAVGRRADVAAFSEFARQNAPKVFRHDMLQGEASPLQWERMERIGKELFEKRYRFQTRYGLDDWLFKPTSLKFRDLHFIVIYFEPDPDKCGSYLVFRGKARSFIFPGNVWEAFLESRGVHGDPDEDDDDAYWSATWEAMDIAEARWKIVVRSYYQENA